MKDRKKPAIRFKGFTEDWEQRKLNKISDKVTEKNIGLQYIETFTNSAEFGIISQRDYFDHEIANMSSLGGYYIVRSEDFVYNPRISATAPVGPINRNKLGRVGVMSPLYTVFRTYDVDTTYLEHFFKSRYWHSFMNFNGDSGARSDRFSIKDAIFFEMNIPIPHIEEQMKIGEYLTHINNLITLHQRKYDKLVNVKKSMLEKMFPRDGKFVPDVRFSGFMEDWEQRKVTELGKIYIGLVTTMTAHYTDEGTLLIRNSDIKDGKFEFGEKPIFLEKSFAMANESRMHQIGDVITVHTGDVGTSAVISENEDKSIGFATIVTRPNKTIIDPSYLCTFLNTERHKKWAVAISTGDGRTNYNLGDYFKLVVPVPSIKEQKQIAMFIENLNNLITLHQRKLEKLKNIKKSCLVKMFI
ncbi:restriction endonuclease subunit S [Peptostreptococcus sp.]